MQMEGGIATDWSNKQHGAEAYCAMTESGMEMSPRTGDINRKGRKGGKVGKNPAFFLWSKLTKKQKRKITKDNNDKSSGMADVFENRLSSNVTASSPIDKTPHSLQKPSESSFQFDRSVCRTNSRDSGASSSDKKKGRLVDSNQAGVPVDSTIKKQDEKLSPRIDDVTSDINAGYKSAESANCVEFQFASLSADSAAELIATRSKTSDRKESGGKGSLSVAFPDKVRRTEKNVDPPSVMGTIVTIETSTRSSSKKGNYVVEGSSSRMSSLKGEQYCNSFGQTQIHNYVGPQIMDDDDKMLANTAHKCHEDPPGPQGISKSDPCKEKQITDWPDNQVSNFPLLAPDISERIESLSDSSCYLDGDEYSQALTSMSSLTGGSSMFQSPNNPSDGLTDVVAKFSDAFNETRKFFSIPVSSCGQCLATTPHLESENEK